MGRPPSVMGLVALSTAVPICALAGLSLGHGCNAAGSNTPAPPGFDGGMIELTTVDTADAFPIAPPGGGWPPERTVAVAGDLDGDGRREVIVSGTRSNYFASRVPRVFRYDRDHDALVPAAPLDVPASTSVSGAIDIDDDGIVDILSTGIAWGRAGGGYEPTTALITGASFGGTDDTPIYLDDIDQDGWLDILEGDSGCCANCRDLHPLVRIGLRTYRDLAESVALNPQTNVQAVFSAQLDSGERIIAAIGWSCGGGPSPASTASSASTRTATRSFANTTRSAPVRASHGRMVRG